MTAKEKAKELFDKYLYYVETVSEYWQKLNAKECAIIAVDEIINEVRTDYDTIQWYRQVKQEIEKL